MLPRKTTRGRRSDAVVSVLLFFVLGRYCTYPVEDCLLSSSVLFWCVAPRHLDVPGEDDDARLDETKRVDAKASRVGGR